MNTASNLHTEPEYSKKESFVNFLLDQYSVSGQEKGSGDYMFDVRSDINTLLHRVAALAKSVEGLQERERHEPTRDVIDLISRMSSLHESIYQHVFPLLTRVQPTTDERGATATTGEAGMNTLALYERENVRLKQENMKLIRDSYASRFARKEEARGRLESVSSEARGRGAVAHLLEQVKALEEAKASLIRDNVELNTLSNEILEENKDLRKSVRDEPDA